MKHVHIIPAGSNKENLLESLKQSDYPVQRIYLVIQRGDEERVAEELEQTLKVLIDVEKVYVDSDFYGAVYEILNVVRREKDVGNRVFINVAGCSRLLALACYISAQLSESMLYTTQNGTVTEISFPPLKKINDDKLRILKALQENNGEIMSVKALIDVVEGLIDESRGHMAQRAKMRYHLDGLESDGLIETFRVGKETKIVLTELGWAYSIII